MQCRSGVDPKRSGVKRFCAPTWRVRITCHRRFKFSTTAFKRVKKSSDKGRVLYAFCSRYRVAIARLLRRSFYSTRGDSWLRSLDF